MLMLSDRRSRLLKRQQQPADGWMAGRCCDLKFQLKAHQLRALVDSRRLRLAITL